MGTRLLHPLLLGGHAGLYPSVFLAGFREESVLPCPAFGQTSFSHFSALVVISVVSDGKAASAALRWRLILSLLRGLSSFWCWCSAEGEPWPSPCALTSCLVPS